jgi:hypothetical protein
MVGIIVTDFAVATQAQDYSVVEIIRTAVGLLNNVMDLRLPTGKLSADAAEPFGSKQRFLSNRVAEGH